MISTCLGSLYDANESNLITGSLIRDPNQQSKVLIKSLQLTERGIHCLKKNANRVCTIFDRFFYLQLVVDDCQLPLPRVLIRHMGQENLPGYDYILESDNGRYASKAREMIVCKADRVLYFLTVLEISLELEKKKYFNVFRKLGNWNVEIPSVSLIKEQVVREIDLLGKLGEKQKPIKPIEDRVFSQRVAIKAQLEELYSATS